MVRSGRGGVELRVSHSLEFEIAVLGADELLKPRQVRSDLFFVHNCTLASGLEGVSTCQRLCAVSTITLRALASGPADRGQCPTGHTGLNNRQLGSTCAVDHAGA